MVCNEESLAAVSSVESLMTPSSPNAGDGPKAHATTERLRQQLVRFETLFALLDELRAKEDLASIAQLVSARWKYLADISSWRLVVPRGSGFSVVDGSRGQAQVGDADELPPWDRHHWAAPRPRLLSAAEVQGGPPPPSHVAGLAIHEWLVIPYDQLGQRVGLLTLASRHLAFSEVDHKFIRLFGGQLVDHVALVEMRRRDVERLQGLARRDALTGALNRLGILEAAAALLSLARRRGEPVSLMMVDVDHFKAINDTHGHAVGDAVLRELVTRFTALTRTGEHFGRFGGEEFVFALYPCSGPTARSVAERIRAGIAERPFVIDLGAGQQVPVTISLGVACSEDEPAATVDSLLARADKALYAAKRAGRNRIEMSGPPLAVAPIAS
jgi:diguanylate cyclase (GGDEF)-like protein